MPPSTTPPNAPAARKADGWRYWGIHLSRFNLMGATLIGGFWIPLRLAFPAVIQSPWADTLFDYSILVLLLIPLLVAASEFRRTHRGIIWLLALGLAALPLVSLTEPTLGNTATLLYLAKLPLLRGFREAWKLRQRLDALHPVAARLGSVGAMLPLVIHLFACGWVGLGSGSTGPHQDLLFEYGRAVYWTITTLATVGYGDIHPQTLPQMMYACLAMMVGVGFFGFILGNVATLLFRMDAERERYLTKVDRAEAFMRHHQIPKPLRVKVRAYYRYLWESRHGYEDRTVLATLPPILRAKIVLALHAELIDRVPFFRGAERRSVEAIVLAFKPRVAVPGEILFRAGEPADALYVIQRGAVDILTATGAVIATLHSGDFFGEMALLDHAPRNATVRATDYCDLFVLAREAFDPILDRYPDFARHIRAIAAARNPQRPPGPTPDPTPAA
ncbi:MAG: cyclic nucleotide-binding domain-containing protein [Candidatus Competibacteraceae bacterium]|nr:cyclic nucleotide-binding domain-containing protein [Candidatus Competibacteraceae bacterium]